MTRRASDVLLDILRDEGITHIFGNPGSTEMPLMDALVNAPDITYVLGLQEATAVGGRLGADLWQGGFRQSSRHGRSRQCHGRARRVQGE
jgi:benzoylformate decarboxylase